MKKSAISNLTSSAVIIIGLILINLSICKGYRKQSGSVFEPIVVGSPPHNAYIVLVRLDNGKIRHYNYTTRNREGRAFYIRSRDNGFTWDTVYVNNEWKPAYMFLTEVTGAH